MLVFERPGYPAAPQVRETLYPDAGAKLIGHWSFFFGRGGLHLEKKTTHKQAIRIVVCILHSNPGKIIASQCILMCRFDVIWIMLRLDISTS